MKRAMLKFLRRASGLLALLLLANCLPAQVEIARGKPASQSSNFSATSGQPGKAVDGNTSGVWATGSVSHTKGKEGENNPWWEVDLGQAYDITRIQIWNRTDACCRERLNNMQIFIKQNAGDAGQSFLAQNHQYRADEKYPLVFTNNKQGRYVRIQLFNPNGVLALAEVKVYGRPFGPGPSAPEYNIGTGIAKVTDPATGLGMQGMSEDKQKTAGVETDLYARAFIIEHNTSKKRVVLVNADIWACTYAIKSEVVRQLKAKYGQTYTTENVMISGTHNHSGPGGFSYYYLYNHSMRGFDSHNFACIVAGMVLSIEKAHQNLGPGKIYINSGEIADCGRNRSLAAYNNNPADERSKYASETDKNMLLLKFVKLSGATERPVGVLSWYAIHPTDRGQKNTMVCGDNKGYASFLFEKEMGTNYSATETFVAAFANSSAGDVSGNVEFGEIPDGTKDKQHMELHGKKQYDKAKELYTSAKEVLKGDLDYRHTFVDMVAKAGAPGALGLSMFAGSTEDSNPGSYLKEGITEYNITATERTEQTALATLFITASGVPCPTVANLSRAEVNAQLPKPVTLAPGVTNPIPGFPSFVPLTPTILPVQLFRVGQLAIPGIPAEFTTMSGRRLQAAMLEELGGLGVTKVALGTYSNEYSQYVATEQEYQKQEYEGASTLFGPQTLNTYLTEFRALAKALRNKSSVAAGLTPPDLSGQVKRIPRVTIRNQSGSAHTLYFYEQNDLFLAVEFSKKTIPARGEMALDLARPNGDAVASVRTKAKVALDNNKQNVPAVSGSQLITITANGTLQVGAYTPPPR